MRRFLFVSVLSVSLANPISVGAEVYRCTGSSGEPLFSQVPCGGTAQVPVRPQPEDDLAQGLRPGERAWLAQRAKQRSGRAGRAGAGAAGVKRRDPDAADAHRCLRTRRDLETVKARLRRGYKPSQGEKLRRRRQRYEDYLSSFCD